MQAVAYEGHFKQGKFYVAGKVVRIPERRRVVLSVLNDEVADDEQDIDVALYDAAKANDDGYRVGAEDLRKKYGI